MVVVAALSVLVGVRGTPEWDIESLVVMGWGLGVWGFVHIEIR